MKKLYLFFIVICVFCDVEASHNYSSHIEVKHLTGYNYEVQLTVLGDVSGLPRPSQATISVFQKESATLLNQLTLSIDNSTIINPNIPGCPAGMDFSITKYSTIVTLSPSTYNSPGGYVFLWTDCCGNPGVVNISNPGSTGHSAVTVFPPVIDSLGNQIVNQSPVLRQPFIDHAYNLWPYSKNFGGFDADGDSMVFELFTPFDQGSLNQGSNSGIFAPFTDPASQMPPIQWASGFNPDDQVHGYPGPNPSPNRLKINASTGVISLIPNVTGPSIFIYGVVCYEYRNGKLIGAIYRNHMLLVFHQSTTPIFNAPPTVHVPNNQALANWLGDTLIFTGSPVCVQLNVTDPDTLADIRLELVQSDYDPQDINFVQSTAIIQGNDTFSTALCFSPDTFLSYSTEARLLALDNICHNVKSDTLSFFFKFVGYSNAGSGGRNSFAINSNQPHIDLFGLLGGNPNPGGQWIDLDNSNLLNANNQFIAQNVLTPSTYRFQYIDQQPNYPADTAELELEFFVVQSLGSGLDGSEIKIYPNPSSANITFDVSDDFIGNTVSVYTLDSREVQRFILESNINSISIEKSGMYLIRIEGNSKVHKVFIEN